MQLKMKRQSWLKSICFLSLILTLQQVILPVLTGHFFGSQGDWISQHVAIAETLRDAMLESKHLIPQFLQLGAGSSVYNFSYYGLLRPDVIVSCFFPKIAIRYFIAGYMILSIYASGILTYFWLRAKALQNQMALFGAIILTSSTAFYHAHHQIMFINYMPFLILALIGVDRILEQKKSSLLIFSCFMICIHSFYYAPSCILVIGLYGVTKIVESEERFEKKITIRMMLAVTIAVGLSMILLLPTALEIFSGSKDGGQFATKSIQVVWLDSKGLLYSSYSCGLTVLALFSLIHCIMQNRKRVLALCTLLCISVPYVSLVLNGGLYAREKILIPFLPICVQLTAETLQQIWNKKTKQDVLALLLCCIPGLFSKWKIIIFTDIGILCLWIFLQRGNHPRLKKIRKYTFILCLIPSVASSFLLNLSECFPVIGEKSGMATQIIGYISKKEIPQKIPRSFLEVIAKEGLYRTEILDGAFCNGNLTKKELKRTTMYSSVTNPVYATFFYDTMKNAISYNNRVALIAGEHPYFNYFMGIKYFIANKEQAPLGYKKVMEEGDLALYEKKEVLPICYGTTKLMSDTQFEQLQFPDTLEALCTSAVVDAKGIRPQFDGHAQKINVEQLYQPLPEKISVLQFHVNRKDAKEVSITVNHIKNKLSSKLAPYPNHNTNFTYVMDAVNGINSMSIKASKGEYELTDVNAYLLDKKYLKHNDFIKPEDETVKGRANQVFYGKIKMPEEGFFITSYPWRKGYHIFVDGIKKRPEMVNTAFLGFPLEKGMHRIEILFETPGYKEGKAITQIAVILWDILIVIEHKNKEERVNEAKK